MRIISSCVLSHHRTCRSAYGGSIITNTLCLIEVHITTSKRGVTCTQQAFIRHSFMYCGVRGHPPIGLAAESCYTHTVLIGYELL